MGRYSITKRRKVRGIGVLRPGDEIANQMRARFRSIGYPEFNAMFGRFGPKHAPISKDGELTRVRVQSFLIDVLQELLGVRLPGQSR